MSCRNDRRQESQSHFLDFIIHFRNRWHKRETTHRTLNFKTTHSVHKNIESGYLYRNIRAVSLMAGLKIEGVVK